MENYISTLYALHDGSVAWINELEFMNDEQLFLEHLLSTHFLDLSSSKLYDTTRKLIKKLKEVEHLGLELSKEVRLHNNKIATILDEKKKESTPDIVNEHKVIEKNFESYSLKFKYVKKKIFSIIKEIMLIHKQKLLINKT